MAKGEFELVFERLGGFKPRALPVPPRLASSEVLVRPKYVGICGSDLYLMESQKGELRLGHEWVGVIEKVGKKSAGLKPGDVVTSTGTLACFGCVYCKDRQTHFCDHAEYLSSDRIGALRSWMVLHRDNLVRVPGRLSRAHVIHEVVAVAEEAMRLIREQCETKGQEVLILGGGPIGTMVALIAKRSGMRPIVVEKRAHRHLAAKRAGVECILLTQALMDRSYSARFSIIVDATSDGFGDTGGFRQLPIFAKKGFVGLMVGKYLKPQEIPRVFNRMGAKLIWMRGMPQATLKVSVRKWNHLIEDFASNYISDVVPVNRANAAFDSAAAKKSRMKVVIQLF